MSLGWSAHTNSIGLCTTFFLINFHLSNHEYDMHNCIHVYLTLYKQITKAVYEFRTMMLCSKLLTLITKALRKYWFYLEENRVAFSPSKGNLKSWTWNLWVTCILKNQSWQHKKMSILITWNLVEQYLVIGPCLFLSKVFF